MPKIQDADLIQRIVRRYGIVGSAGPDSLAPEILPVTIVDELLTGETYGPRFAMGNCYQAAVVGELGQGHLHNPPNSGIILRVQGVWVCCPTAGATGYFIIGYNSGVVNELATPETARYLDRRIGDNPTGRLTRGSGVGTGIAVGGELWRGYTRFDETCFIPLHDSVMREDDGMHVCFSVVNQLVVYDFIWSEEAVREGV